MVLIKLLPMLFQLKHLFWVVPFICCSCASPLKKPEVSAITSETIFKTPVTNNSHAATIVELAPNKVMAAWFGGSYEGAKDVGIYTASYNGKFWSTPSSLIKPLVTENDTLPCWNPVLFKSKSKQLYLFYKVGKNPREWFGAMIISTNNGKSWGEPKYLPQGILGPIKNKPIEIKAGVLVCGSSTESVENNVWRVHVERYTEATNTWEKIPIENKKGFEIIQPTFLEHGNNTIQMLCRSKHNKIISSWSMDNGKSWSQTDSIPVLNSNSGIDALTLEKNSFLLVNNPLKQGADWFNGRNVLDVEFSSNGITWEKLFDLENQEKGEFSYPAIIQTTDKKIHVVYTYNRKFMKHTTFQLN